VLRVVHSRSQTGAPARRKSANARPGVRSGSFQSPLDLSLTGRFTNLFSTSIQYHESRALCPAVASASVASPHVFRPWPFTVSPGHIYAMCGGGPDRRWGRGSPFRDFSPSGRDSDGIAVALINCPMPVSEGLSGSVMQSEVQSRYAL
jgi:hypothetical protein